MKKFFTVALMSLVFMACNKEESKETPKEETQETPKKESKETPKEETHPIEGTWYLQKEKNVNDTEFKEVDDCQKKSHISFSDKKVSFVIHRERGENNCEQSGILNADLNIKEKSITFTEDGELVKYTFSIDGDILKIITENEGIIIYKKHN